MVIVDATIHSFSLWHHFAHKPDFDSIAFVDLAEMMGLSGVSLSLNDSNYRHLGGRETERMDRLRARLERSAMSLEIDTSDTDPNHMKEMIDVAVRMGATSLRTYTRHGGTPQEMMVATIRDLAALMAYAEKRGVVVVLENHEDFTGPELVKLVEAINSPYLKILYDYGNSQMVLEDPCAALDAVLPHVYSVHAKDHVMVRPEHVGRLSVDNRTEHKDCLAVAGVPFGEGFLPIKHLTKRLLDHGLRRLTFENVWAYAAPIAPNRQLLGDVVLGKGAFAFLNPPFDPAKIVLDQSQYDASTLVDLEYKALVRGLDYFYIMLRELGCDGRWNQL